MSAKKGSCNVSFDTAGKYRGGDENQSDLPFWELSVILKATDHFSSSNKLGEGGFGPVYKVNLII